MTNAVRPLGHTFLVALIAVAPALLLGACGRSPDEQINDQVAIAKEAADRAVAAQKAAEQAAKLSMARANPGSFGQDGDGDVFDDSPSDESVEPIDNTSEIDSSADQ